VRAEYTSIYDQLTLEYVQSFRESFVKLQPHNSAELVAYTVFKAVQALGLWPRMRPDAFHFLVVNFHQMIVAPIQMRRSETLLHEQSSIADLENERELDEAVSEDIHTILSAASDDPIKGEISGHAILEAVAKKYKKLRTTRLEIWG
jgi:hypothetical protein